MSDTMRPGAPVPGPACARSADILPVLAQNGADADTLAQAHAHVAGCAYCSARLAAYAALDGALARAYGSGAGYAAVDIAAIMRMAQVDERDAASDAANEPPQDGRTRHAHRPRQPSRRLADLAGIAAAVLLVIAIVGLILSHMGIAQQGGGPKRTPVPSITPPAQPTMTPTTPPSAARSFRSVQMLSPTTGWALLSDGGVGRTTDGGVHWTDVTPPGAQVADNNTDLGAISGSDVWMADAQRPCARIWHTMDGGRVWTSSSVPHTRIQTAPSAGERCGAPVFVDAQHGWLMESLGVAAGSEAVAIFRTTDGGATWSEISDAMYKNTTTPGGQPLGVLPFGGDKSGIAFVTASTGWVTGTSAGEIWLYVTHDGGQTWSQQTPPLLPGMTAQVTIFTNPPVFFSATSGVLPVTTGDLTDFYVTHDGGHTWTPTRAVPSAQVFAWSFTDASHWWAMAGNAICVTSDAGQSWATITPSGAFNKSVTFEMVSASTGYAVAVDSSTGAGSLIKTTDGGHTWATVAAVIG